MEYGTYRDYYVSVKQGYHTGDNIDLKIYLMNENDYIVQSNCFNLVCPFCRKKIYVNSFECPQCGHTMHEIGEKLYTDWNISGHKFYITYGAPEDYPANERKRVLYDAVRRFVKNSMPFAVTNHFKGKLEEIHLSTMVLIYQKGLGIDKVEDEIKEEVEADKKMFFMQTVRKSLGNNAKAISKVWHNFQKFLEYKSGSIKFKALDFTMEISISDNETKHIDVNYFEKLYSYFKDKANKCLEEAYVDNVLINYKACKQYMMCLSLLNKTIGIKYTTNMVALKIYGELDLSNDCIYRTVRLSLRDTIEETNYLRYYHKECGDHKCEKVYLKIPLLLETGELIIRTVLGTYCDNCKKYFVLDTEFKKMLFEGKIQTQITFSEAGGHFSGVELSAESLLRKCGYTVNAQANISKENRQKLLKAIINNKLYTPAKIVSHFRFLISMNNNVISRDMSSAIKKWEEDILFLQQNYG